VLEAQGKAQSIILKAEAQATALKQIEEALGERGAKEASHYIIGQRYIQAMQSLARKNNTLIMPMEPKDV